MEAGFPSLPWLLSWLSRWSLCRWWLCPWAEPSTSITEDVPRQRQHSPFSPVNGQPQSPCRVGCCFLSCPGSSPSSPLCTSPWQHRSVCDPSLLLGAMGSGVQIPPVFLGTVLLGLPHAAGSVGSNIPLPAESSREVLCSGLSLSSRGLRQPQPHSLPRLCSSPLAVSGWGCRSGA